MKKTTYDEYLQSVYKVVYYIEENYSNDLKLECLAKISGFSKYHFHRIFHAVIGETLNSFIRRVRLANSASKLTGRFSVTEVAMQSGYETPASFAKAFKECYGLSPKMFFKRKLQKKGEIMIEPKIVKFEPLEVLCVRKRGDYTQSAKEAWSVLMKFAYTQKIKYKKNLMGKDAEMFGIGYDDPNTTPAENLRYDACISYDDKSVTPEGEIVVKTIKGGKHLYYLHKGAYDGLKAVYDDLMRYVIDHELTLADRPPFERYLNRDPRRTKPQNLKTEIYIPIEG